jgi:hypothetical protein
MRASAQCANVVKMRAVLARAIAALLAGVDAPGVRERSRR